MKKKILAFIPARGGSKGVKNKNAKLINGKPLISYTIEAAKNSGIFEDIIVSTDSEEIARIAREYGASVPFLRPIELAQDTSPTIDAIDHCINYMKNNHNRYYDIIAMLQPTSPLRTETHIKEAFKKLNTENADFVISVCECDHSPLWANTLNKNLTMDTFMKDEIKTKRRQELPDYYRVNGAIFIGNVKSVLKNRGFYGKNSFAYIMPKLSSVDIDDMIDFKLAEILLAQCDK